MNSGISERPELVDTHAHLDDQRLRDDLPAVLERARTAGVRQIVAIGTTANDSESVAQIAREHAGVFAAVGIHPNDASEATPTDWQRVLALLEEPNVVALGETGLDRHWDRTPFPLQQEWFQRHLELGRQTGLPLVIHCRESQQDLIAQLTQFQAPVHGVLHSFTGSWDDAQAFLDLGLHVSFAGMVTFTNRTLDSLREVAARVPLDRLLVETDSPYLSPHPHRGVSNEPARVTFTAERLAQVRALPLADLAQITTANARRLFNLPAEQML
ncbi:TatD DNase family protein [Singulisphaera sp. GP187]|uniref:TatD family hydrolase n=1 Tax=Singulisphaera sp. GP187 TaxID=1882752 RepID=UPI0009279B43|nr:TatD family hydrolase [Singulisphaera sp. GP187]SIN88936.1 TatD DNase family protein [Singulisphaera sp. GP187]